MKLKQSITQLKNQWRGVASLLAVFTSGSAALFLSSCGVAHAPPMAPVVEADAGSSANYKTAQRAPQLRPGMATGWGDEIKSGIHHSTFRRASSRPKAIASIYYNDKEGIKAMTESWSYRGSGMQKAANGLVEWGVKSGWGSLKNVHSNGKRFVVGTKGSNYALVIKNLSHSRLEVVLSVDGLDVMNGKPASTKRRGYIIQPGKTLTVKGFRKSADAVAAFKFSSVRDSYSRLSNQGTRNVGVIGMAVFTEKGVDPWRYSARELKRRGGASPFAEAPHLQAR